MVTDNQAKTIYKEATESGRSISDIARSLGFDPVEAHNAINKLRHSEASEVVEEANSSIENVMVAVRKRGRPPGSTAAKKVVEKVSGGGKIHWATKAAAKRRLLRESAAAVATPALGITASSLTAAVLHAFAKHASEAKSGNMSYAEAVGIVMGAVEKLRS